MIENTELELANKFVKETNRNIFLTGKAGTGKTTFLKNLRLHSHKRMIVVAPTGIAAINAEGVTIHSFFQLPFAPTIPYRLSGVKPDVVKINKTKVKIIKSLDLLIIDEVSMVRADTLDAIDTILKLFRNPDKPFGGVQVLMIGDILQLAPIIKEDEWHILRKYYNGIYFFNSLAYSEANPIYIELKHIYRQDNADFIEILNKVRNKTLDQNSLEILNSRYKPNFKPPKNSDYINLTTHNNNAQRINDIELESINSKTYKFTASLTGDFNEHLYPTDFQLKLKVGAQVMFIKNDSSHDKLYYNGKIGKISKLSDTSIWVICSDSKRAIEVKKEHWDNAKYSLDKETNEIKEEVIGTFTQYPLRLAWAITIHKSQGLTFDKAIIDTEAAFAHGQTYVALSRCRTLEGIVLSSPIAMKSIIFDKSISQFNEQAKELSPDNKDYTSSKRQYELSLIQELFNYKNAAHFLSICIHILQQNDHNINGNMLESMNLIYDNIINKYVPIGNKFASQVNSLFTKELDENKTLQERINKACTYFLENSRKELSNKIKNIHFTCDNVTIGSKVKELYKKILEIILVKEACYEECISGFDIDEYLKVKANKLIELEDKKVKFAEPSIAGKCDHPELYEILKEWRAKRAKELDLRTYNIISNKMMLDLSQILPQTATELKLVKGLGVKRIQNYGNDILNIISRYRKDKDISGTQYSIL
ncbi:MAG: AAA family ATPase [Marinifilaceae bacterium]|jgi:hypothetical protein|nr:AAA family ATPase [Marinifilaceae bacterium]